MPIAFDDWMDRGVTSAWRIAVIGCGLLLLGGCGDAAVPEPEEPRALRVMRIGDVANVSGRAFPGRAAAQQEVNLSFRVGGPLITYPVKVGHKVSTGDVVARIDPNDYQVTVRNVQGELDRAKAGLALAEKEYRRAMEANAKNPQLISESEVDRRLSGRDRSRADVSALEAALQAAEDELDYSTLRAPFDGTIVNTFVENFETVRAEQPIVRLLDNTRIEFRFSVPETLVMLLPLVENLRVRFDAYPDIEIQAEIQEVGAEASELTRTYPVSLILDQPEGVEILPGMAGRATGEAAAAGGTDQPSLIVPVDAVFSTQAAGVSFVWVVDAGTQQVARREVGVGQLRSVGMEITSGLEAGELVAVAGVHFLEEGQAVVPVFD